LKEYSNAFESSSSQVASAQAAINAAEICAVMAGRKPLFHEAWGVELSAVLKKSLRPVIRKFAVCASRREHLVVYNKDIVRIILDSDATFYRPNGETDGKAMWRAITGGFMGELLGYGARSRFEGDCVTVKIFDETSLEAYAGFRAPAPTAEAFATARTTDYAAHFQQVLKAQISER
jgi:hypothetical protein